MMDGLGGEAQCAFDRVNVNAFECEPWGEGVAGQEAAEIGVAQPESAGESDDGVTEFAVVGEQVVAEVLAEFGEGVLEDGGGEGVGVGPVGDNAGGEGREE